MQRRRRWRRRPRRQIIATAESKCALLQAVMRKNAAARVHAAKWQREKTDDEGANFCGGAKNDPHAGGGSSTAQSAAGALASCILANRLSLSRQQKNSAAAARRTQNEGGYISLAGYTCPPPWGSLA